MYLTSVSNSKNCMLPDPIPSPVPVSSDDDDGEREENNEDDDCSLGVNDLTDAKEGLCILTGSQRTISPMSQRGDADQNSSSLPLNMETGSSLSKLDLLRARNREVRRRGSLKIAELKKSLHASSGELLVSPTTKKNVVTPLTVSDDATAVTVSSRTWTEAPPTPSSPVKRVIGLRPPLEVEMKDNESIRSIRTFETLSSLTNFRDRYKRLKQENELLRRQLTRLVEHHNDILRKERMNLRMELQNRARASRNRLRMAVLLLVIGLAAQILMNHVDHKNATTKLSRFSDDSEEPLSVPCIDVVEDSKDRMTNGSGSGVDEALGSEEISSLMESRIEEDPPLGLIIDTASALLEGIHSNSTGETFHREDEELTHLGENILLNPKETRRQGFLKRVLFNFRNNQMGIWLKHVKM